MVQDLDGDMLKEVIRYWSHICIILYRLTTVLLIGPRKKLVTSNSK